MHLHFIGIGGSAMGSVALACQAAGHRVTGSDQAVYPPMSDVLKGAGIEWTDGYDAERLRMLAPDLVVVGNAVSRGNPEVELVLNDRMAMTSMAELVGSLFISRNTSIVCAGTHGKTTTSSMTAWIMECSLRQPGFLIGGVPRGLSVGCRPVPAEVHDTHGGVFVVEGDEYDTAFFDKRSKFVHYRPTIAIINNLEFDHADIFSSVEDIAWSFRQLVRIVPSNGCILVNADDERAMQVAKNNHTPVHAVGLAESADFRIVDIEASTEGSSCSLVHHGKLLGRVSLAVHGVHNLHNASMAVVAAMQADVTFEEASTALRTYQPPKRRLERIGEWKGRIVIDDFAHHPTAIEATLSALGAAYPDRAIHAVFEPRSNTTSRSVFQTQLGECFRGARSACIGPVNRPERYAVEERLDTARLVADIERSGTKAVALASELAQRPDWGMEVIPWLQEQSEIGDIIVVLSNGNVGGLRTLLTTTV